MTLFSNTNLKRATAAIAAAFCFCAAAQAQFIIGGTATSLGSGCYQLTTTSTNQGGYVYQNLPINLADTIDLKFRVNLGSQDAAGADGMIFVLRDSIQSALIGSLGGGIGFLGTVNPPGGSVGVEIDTYNNGGYGDPASDHIGILKNWDIDHNGSNSLAAPVQALAGNINIEDGNYHTFNVKWNPGTQVLKVYMDCIERISYTGDIINQIFNGNNMVYWGFIGTTGGSTNNQSFCIGTPIESLVTPLDPLHDICKGDTVYFNAGDPAVAYLWTPSTSLNSSTISNPFAFPIDTTTYIVRQTYQCDTLYDTTTVRVIPPDFNTSATVTNASCKDLCNGVVNLTVSGGSGQYTYQWSNAATTEDISALCDGMYIVKVQNVLSTSPTYLCYMKDTFYVTEPQLLVADIFNATKTKCPGTTTCDAKATGTAVGGTPPYNYWWPNAQYTQTTTQLCAGLNYLTVTDSKGCLAVDSVIIYTPEPINTVAFGDTLICIGNVAAIAASSSGGTPPFSFVWHQDSLEGIIVSLVSNEAVTPSVTTGYFVQSFDANGCLGDTASVLVRVRPPLSVTFTAPDTICPYDTVAIIAQGHGGDSTYSYAWEDGFFGPVIFVSPDTSTSFMVTVTDLCGTPYTVGSERIQVGGYHPLVPKIEVEDDSICLDDNSIYMIASSRGGFGGPEEFIFTWMHNGSHSQYEFIAPIVTTEYVVKVEDLCLSPVGYDTVTVYVGQAVIPDIKVSPTVVCRETDAVIRLNNYNPLYTYDWYMSSVDSLQAYKFDSVLFFYNQPGCHAFSMDITTDFGCHTHYEDSCAVFVKESPVAQMDWYPIAPTNVDPYVNFKDESYGHVSNYWVINFDTIRDKDAFQYEFYEREEPFNVLLVAESADGCMDTSIRQVVYTEESLIHYPNSFTPNGDGLNDVFQIEGEGFQFDGFDLTIFDRWGKQLFRTVRPEHGWDGRTETGEWVGTGVYFMRLAYRDHRNIEKVIYSPIYVGATGTSTTVK